MGATGIATDAAKNVAANALGTAYQYLTLLNALTLQASVAAGNTTCSVDLSVQAGDVLTFEKGGANEETAVVASVTGSSPYTVTLTAPLAKTHPTGAYVSHVPVTSATVHEIGVTRTASGFGSPSPAGVVTSSAGAISVPSGNVVGSLAVFSALSGGTYYDATPVSAQSFLTGSGSYQPVWVETLS